MQAVKNTLIIILVLFAIAYAQQDTQKIVLKLGKHDGFYRFVFVCEKPEIINSIKINLLNNGKIKIFFPEIFEIEFEGRVLQEYDNIKGLKTHKKDKIFTVETSNIEEIKVSKYDSPSRLIIDAYFKNLIEKKKLLKPLSMLIDPGHGGKDIGLQINENTEKDITLYIATALASRLTQKGIKAELTRTSDEELSLDKRLKIENNLKPSLFLSIHLCSTDNFYIYTSPKKKNVPQTLVNLFVKRLKENFSESVYVEKLPLFVLEKTISPSLMIEIPKRALISDKNYINRIIDVTVQVITEKIAMEEKIE